MTGFPGLTSSFTSFTSGKLFRIITSALILLSAGLFFSCSGKDSTQTLRIAEQYGLAYAPLQLIRLEKQLEEAGIKTEWVKLINTASIREAMLAGRVDIGFMGIPPFLIGRDKGMDWKIFTGLCRAPLGLVSRNRELNSLADLRAEDRIALPQPGSIQHILLSMAAERELGDSRRFDSRLVTLSHPDGFSALSKGSGISAHYTSPPYLFEELKLKGARLLSDGETAFGGPFTFIVGVARGNLSMEKQKLLRNFNRILIAAMERFESDPESTIQTLKSEYAISESLLTEYLLSEGLEYTPEILGVERFQDFMYTSALIESSPAKIDSLILKVAGEVQQ